MPHQLFAKKTLPMHICMISPGARHSRYADVYLGVGVSTTITSDPVCTVPLPQCLVIAGLGDVNRPAEKLSVGQAGALAATGLIWSRSVQGRERGTELSVGQAGALAATGLIWSRSVQGREREQELSVGQAGALAATGLIWSRSVDSPGQGGASATATRPAI